nr:immunoglobulin heavy chain junction region [Mus musculus]
CARYPHYFDYW